jgi:Domain of unknown function (DUF3786)
LADSSGDTPRRYRAALVQARKEWAAADHARRAAQAGCGLSGGGVVVPFLGRSHVVDDQGAVTVEGSGGQAALGQGSGEPVHVAVTIALLHYLLRADGSAPSGRWIAFRELPDALFYAASFASRAEQPLARAFGGEAATAGSSPAAEIKATEIAAAGGPAAAAEGSAASAAQPGLAGFRRAALSMGADTVPLGDAAYCFAVLPRLPVTVVVWATDEEFPAEASVLFDESAGHYLPTEDLAGLGESLARTLLASSR